MNGSVISTSTVPLSAETVRLALELPDFNVTAAHGALSPSPRPLVRPSGKPGEPRIGAVLLALYEKAGAPQVLLIRRGDGLTYHPGQISFPGGRQETGESLRETALREAFEEVGLVHTNLQMLGQLAPVYISPSDFMVHPFVAWHVGAPSLLKQDTEVAEIIETPLDLFLNSLPGPPEKRMVNGREVTVPFYRLGPHKVWGATAMILSELVQRINACSAQN